MTARNISIIALLVGPAVCAVDQLASYTLATRAATRAGGAPTAAITLAGAVVIFAALVISWVIFREQVDQPSGEGDVDLFLAGVGVATNLFFLLVVAVGFGAPQWFLNPTD
jgi:hypothetical protein